MKIWTVTGVSFAMCASGFGQDGKKVFQTYCGACHGLDGKGANNGQFPPLALSPWVKGKPDRMVQAVLHGLQGPLSLEMPEGRSLEYDLAMPPQGGTLSDGQLAAVITYVRSAWGNQASAVTAAEVKAQREMAGAPEGIWQTKDLLKKYPLPTDPFLREMGEIRHLLSSVYKGDFKSLADLRAAKGRNVEEEQEGLLSFEKIKERDGFGIVWTGELSVPADGEYEFFLDSDDGSAVSLNGQEILSVDRLGAIKKAISTKVSLKKGLVPVKIEYFEFKGEEGIRFGWKAKGKKTVWLQDGKMTKEAVKPSIMIIAPLGEAVIYRNFIAGTTPRAIGVGYSEGVNLAMSADTMSLDLLWTGKFMDGARHWLERGQGNQPPAGKNVVRVNDGPAFAILKNAGSPWPEKYGKKLQPEFYGHELDGQRHPRFFYQLGKFMVRDKCTPLQDATGFSRELALDSATAGTTAGLYFSVFSGGKISALGEGAFLLDDTLMVKAEDATLIQKNGRLLLPLKQFSGRRKMTLIYQWK